MPTVPAPDLTMNVPKGRPCCCLGRNFLRLCGAPAMIALSSTERPGAGHQSERCCWGHRGTNGSQDHAPSSQGSPPGVTLDNLHAAFHRPSSLASTCDSLGLGDSHPKACDFAPVTRILQVRKWRPVTLWFLRATETADREAQAGPAASSAAAEGQSAQTGSWEGGLLLRRCQSCPHPHAPHTEAHI